MKTKTKLNLILSKGQLILKGLFGVFKSTKKPMKFCKDFSPSLAFNKKLNKKGSLFTYYYFFLNYLIRDFNFDLTSS